MSQQVFASTMTLNTFKGKRVAAKTGYDLLKRKSDALTGRFRAMLHDIVKTKSEIGEQMKSAAFSMAEATWAAGDFKYGLRRKVADSSDRPRAIIRIHQDNVAGVRLPQFDLLPLDMDSRKAITLTSGGKQIEKSREKWESLVQSLVKLAGLQSSFLALDEAIRITNRRVNALDNVILPQVELTIQFIETEMDELEREDTYRLKKVLQVKAKNEAIDQIEADLRKKARSEAAKPPAPSTAGPANILGTDLAEDEDIVF